MSSFFPNSGFLLSGTNLTEASHVLWGPTRINSDRLIFEGTTGVKGIVPASAASQDKIFIITNDGEAKEILGTQPTIALASGDAIKVGDLENTKAAAGDIITVTGENFFRVTNVNFGQTPASFKVRSSREIEVTVPVGAEATGISVSSSIRPSASNLNSGISSNNFIAVPQIVSVSPSFQVPGQPITVSGSSFASVTGLRFPNRITGEVIFNSSGNSFQANVPTGKTSGPIALLLSDDTAVTGNVEQAFVSHLANIERIVPASGVIAGNLITIEGENFFEDILYFNSGTNRVKVKIGDVDANEFKIINDSSISGQVPSSIKRGDHTVSLYSNNNDIYPSGVTINITGVTPSVSGTDLEYALTGERINITGKELLQINKVTLTRKDITGVSINVTGSGILKSSFSDRLGINIPTGLQSGGFESGRNSFFVDVSVSGLYGASATLESGFFVQGNPFIESLEGGLGYNRQPNSTGILTGLNLIKNSDIIFIDADTDKVLTKTKATGVTGSGNYTTESFFKFPPEIDSTGINIQVKNFAGTSNLLQNVPVWKRPVISGFSPLSGAEENTITVSGFFSGLHSSKVKVSNLAVDDLTTNGTTGISFKIPTGALSDFITIISSGGNIESTGKLSIFPKKPLVSGISPAIAPGLTYSVLGEGNRVNIFGDNLNLVNRAITFDSNGGEINQDTFVSKNAKQISLNLATRIDTIIDETGTTLNTVNVSSDVSGVFKLRDRFDRVTTGTANFKIAKFSGVSDSYPVFNEEITLSGKFFSGLNASFQNETGKVISGEFQETISTTGAGGSLLNEEGFSIKVKVPRGIVSSPILISGNNNSSILNTTGNIFPLATITGISGNHADANKLHVDRKIRISGINSIGSYSSGDNVVGITGDGKNAFFSINSYSRTTGEDGENLSVFDLNVGKNFSGSGQFFVMSSWEDYNSSGFNFSSSKTHDNINKIIDSNFYNIVYPAPVISGISTGSKFNENTTGFISGDNLTSVTGLFLSGNNSLFSATGFEAISNTLIRFTPPFANLTTGSGILVVQSPDGQGTSEASGGAITIIPTIGVSSFPNRAGSSFGKPEAITGESLNMTGSGFLDTNTVEFNAPDKSVEASFTILSDSGISVTIPQGITEGQEVTLSIQGVSGDTFTTTDKFTIIPDNPAIEFNVVSGRAAPVKSDSTRTSMFTIVETIGGVDYYVTKMVNPDGDEVIFATDKVS